MKLFSYAAVSIVATLCLFEGAIADDDDHSPWRPSNAAAVSITGPIYVERKELQAGKAKLSLRFDSAVDAFKSGQESFPAHIYAVTRMSNPTLLNGRTLCGDQPPTWIVVVPQPPLGLEMDAFTGVERPSGPASPGLCNTFTYTR